MKPYIQVAHDEFGRYAVVMFETANVHINSNELEAMGRLTEENLIERAKLKLAKLETAE